MLQEIAITSGLPAAVVSLEEAAGDYARASKSAATRKAYRLTPPTLLPGAEATDWNHCLPV
jgi:hypothetical protein